MSVETTRLLSRLGIEKVVRKGSSLKICAVAEGSADVYVRLGPTFLWDSAAGAAIAREAGCRVMTRDGEDISYRLSGDLKLSHFIVCRDDEALVDRLLTAAQGGSPPASGGGP